MALKAEIPPAEFANLEACFVKIFRRRCTS
jgi:hypothetical protein